MKKFTYLFTVLTLTFACKKEQNYIQVIDDYVFNIDKNKELTESVTDYVIENNDEITEGSSDYEITDKNGNLLKLVKRASILDSITDFNFYYKNKQLIFAKVYQFKIEEKKTDTIINSSFYFDVNKDYFDKEKLIKQINLKENGMDASIVLSLGDALTVEGLGTKKE